MRIASHMLPQRAAYFSDGPTRNHHSGPPPRPRWAVCALLQTRNRLIEQGDEMPNQMRPIHPGEILEEELQTLGLSARQLARALAVPPHRIASIVHQRRAVTADTALRLGRYFGTSPEFRMNLQSAYDLRSAQQHHGDQITQEVTPREVAV